MWRRYNIGAVAPEDAGDYFSWGNIDGHAEGSGYDFSQVVYDNSTGATIRTDLSLAQDAARANLGAPWRMPTADEFQELNDHCSIEWTTLNDVPGLMFTSNVNGNKIFFPASGRYDSTSLLDRGTRGLYWTSTFASVVYARYLGFNSSGINPQFSLNRHFGISVRAVRDA